MIHVATVTLRADPILYVEDAFPLRDTVAVALRKSGFKGFELIKSNAFIYVVVFLLAFGPSSGIAEDKKERAVNRSAVIPIQPVRSKRVTVDQFCGKCVSTRKMAFEMMNFREANAPRPGEPAPQFSLVTADGDRIVKLADLTKTKPVVLLISSWGCDIFRESLAGLQALQIEYSDQAHFVMVYIREAHPLDGFFGEVGRVNDARSLEERMAHARQCRKQLRLPFLYLVDRMDDPIATQWAAWPVRAYVIDSNNQVIYAGAQGPWGYHPYRGYLHGDGKMVGLDSKYSQYTLEEALERRFPKEVAVIEK